MILGFAIFGALISLIALFSLLTAAQRGDSKIGSSLILLLALCGTVLAIWNLPYWSHPSHQTTEAAKKVSLTSSSQTFSTSSSTTKATTQKTNEQNVKQQLIKSLTKLGSVSFNTQSKTYTLTVTNQSLKKTIAALNQDPSQAKAAKWPKFTNNFAKTSQSLKQALGRGYTFVIRVGHQSPVLVYKDGFVTKNKFES
ncbi:hypothetical protein LBR02_12240 [Levilactobacillus brevis]|uniref:DUF1345 domain-containing protein n=1 Tax=Levilactobacillus brevis TaxID=1580 RepID=UPI0011423353|nr:DUF1345 domain-containing protein [Levilactobacillus brevis]GEA98659.1 hypothetical protein LBR02_12240 [Levilactobacillus brevis]